MSVPLSEQLRAVNREIALRKRVYPRWVTEQKNGMTQVKADAEIGTMEAVAETLRTLIRQSEELPL